jgi:hypothetical protein
LCFMQRIIKEVQYISLIKNCIGLVALMLIRVLI